MASDLMDGPTLAENSSASFHSSLPSAQFGLSPLVRSRLERYALYKKSDAALLEESFQPPAKKQALDVQCSSLSMAESDNNKRVSSAMLRFDQIQRGEERMNQLALNTDEFLNAYHTVPTVRFAVATHGRSAEARRPRRVYDHGACEDVGCLNRIYYVKRRLCRSHGRKAIRFLKLFNLPEQSSRNFYSREEKELTLLFWRRAIPPPIVQFMEHMCAIPSCGEDVLRRSLCRKHVYVAEREARKNKI